MMKLPAPRSTSFCILAITTFMMPTVSATKWECGERSNLPLVGKNYCAAGDLRQIEINLKKALSALLEKRKAEAGNNTALNNAQIAFEASREHQCAKENKRFTEKPFYPMIIDQCKTRLTRLRIDELKAMQQKDP